MRQVQPGYLFRSRAHTQAGRNRPPHGTHIHGDVLGGEFEQGKLQQRHDGRQSHHQPKQLPKVLRGKARGRKTEVSVSFTALCRQAGAGYLRVFVSQLPYLRPALHSPTQALPTPTLLRHSHRKTQALERALGKQTGPRPSLHLGRS